MKRRWRVVQPVMPVVQVGVVSADQSFAEAEQSTQSSQFIDLPVSIRPVGDLVSGFSPSGQLVVTASVTGSTLLPLLRTM